MTTETFDMQDIERLAIFPCEKDLSKNLFGWADVIVFGSKGFEKRVFSLYGDLLVARAPISGHGRASAAPDTPRKWAEPPEL
jgi:hypothetical protein